MIVYRGHVPMVCAAVQMETGQPYLVVLPCLLCGEELLAMIEPRQWIILIVLVWKIHLEVVGNEALHLPHG